MIKKTFLTLLASLVSALPAAAQFDQPALDRLFDNNLTASRPRGPVAAAPAASEETSKDGGWGSPLTGAANGARTGAKFAFLGVLSPAVALMSDGFSRGMSRYYDGPRKGNSGGGLSFGAGVVAAVILYIPAAAASMIGGVLGGIAGAVAETFSRGSTASWDAERTLFDRR